MRPTAAPVDVLIADRDDALRAGARGLLEAAGFTCREAARPALAVGLARLLLPRCVFVELDPVAEGLAVARELGAAFAAARPHVNGLAGPAARLERGLATAAGLAELLTKPLVPAALLEVVRRQVRRPPRRAELGGLSFTQAEALLDWLESRGCADLGVDVGADGAFAVRWSGRGPGPEEARRVLGLG
jgi:DNA-binding response OmpR family regulator